MSCCRTVPIQITQACLCHYEINPKFKDSEGRNLYKKKENKDTTPNVY